MISVHGVSMRYGSKVLFDDVTTTFSAGPPLRPDRPERRRQVHVHEAADRRAARRRRARSCARRSSACCARTSSPSTSSASSTPSSWATHRLWEALAGARAPLRQGRHDRRRRHAPRRARGHRRRRGRLHRRKRRRDPAAGARHPGRPARAHRWASCRAARRCACCWRRRCSASPQALLLDEPTNHLDLDSIHWLREFLVRYDGTLIVISHDRHFLNAVCTHIADIDYETIITYTGGYDDMVLAKTQIRSRIEAENAQREKKIAQLNDFIARFSAPARGRARCTSRRKEVERLQTTELARSNIQRPYIRFQMKRPSGRTRSSSRASPRPTAALPVVSRTSARSSSAARRSCSSAATALGKTTLLKALLADVAEPAARRRPTSTAARSAGATRCRSATSPQDHTGAIEKGMTAVEWLHQFDPDASRQDIHGLLGQMLFSGEEGLKPTDGAVGRRDGAAALLPDHAAEAERAGARRADEPPRPRVDQRAEHRAAEVRGHGACW